MSVDRIKQALTAVRYPVSSSLTLPPECYHDDGWLGHEMNCLFRRGWFGIGRRDQWRTPGDYQAIEVAGVPIVVIMDKDGKLQALSNSCLHRSSRIMTGTGSCKAMVCPFHGWSYDTRGQLISAPRMETADCFSEKQYSLKKFNVESLDGFVFLSLEESPVSLAKWSGDFEQVHAPWSLENLVTGRSRTFDVNCNWKLFIEIFNEYYHLPLVHPQSLNHYYPEPEPADVVIGEYTTQFGATAGNPALLDENQAQSFPVIPTLGEKERNGTRYTWIYPNLTFAASMDCMWIYHVYPITSKSTRVVQTVCFPPETTHRDDFGEKSEMYYQRFDFAINEDIPALEQQQAGMQSPYAVQGRFSALEPCVGNFACWYSQATRNQSP